MKAEPHRKEEKENAPKPLPGVGSSALLGRFRVRFRFACDWINHLSRFSKLPNIFSVLRFKSRNFGLVLYYESRILLLKSLNLFLILWYPCELLLWRVILDIRFIIHFSLFWVFGFFVADGKRPNDSKLSHRSSNPDETTKETP